MLYVIMFLIYFNSMTCMINWQNDVSVGCCGVGWTKCNTGDVVREVQGARTFNATQ